MQERSSQPGKLTATDPGGAIDAVALSLDPVDYAVISHALIAIAREMGTKLVRSSYSVATSSQSSSEPSRGRPYVKPDWWRCRFC